MGTQRLPVNQKPSNHLLLPLSQQKIKRNLLPAILRQLRRLLPPLRRRLTFFTDRRSSNELLSGSGACVSAVAVSSKLADSATRREQSTSPMLSLQSPRCRFSLPIAFSGSGDAQSLSSPASNRRVRCNSVLNRRCRSHGLQRKNVRVRSVGKEEAELRTSSVAEEEEEKRDEYENVDPQDLEYVQQIQGVLELLKKNRDMLFSEVKLTIMIEDPREVERRRLLGIEDPDAPTRDDLVEALEQVNEGKVPENRLALKMLAEEMLQWPNLEEAVPKKKPRKSLYAKATDTGIDPEVAAKRLNIDWDSAAEIGEADDSDETEVPPAVGYGALYLVTAFPVIIGISVVLILFYNSLQ